MNEISFFLSPVVFHAQKLNLSQSNLPRKFKEREAKSLQIAAGIFYSHGNYNQFIKLDELAQASAGCNNNTESEKLLTAFKFEIPLSDFRVKINHRWNIIRRLFVLAINFSIFFRAFHWTFVNIFHDTSCDSFDQQFIGTWKCQSAWVSFQPPPHRPRSTYFPFRTIVNHQPQRNIEKSTQGMGKLLIIKQDGICLQLWKKRKRKQNVKSFFHSPFAPPRHQQQHQR